MSAGFVIIFIAATVVFTFGLMIGAIGTLSTYCFG
jgi:hypothetical protein